MDEKHNRRPTAEQLERFADLMDRRGMDLLQLMGRAPTREQILTRLGREMTEFEASQHAVECEFRELLEDILDRYLVSNIEMKLRGN